MGLSDDCGCIVFCTSGLLEMSNGSRWINPETYASGWFLISRHEWGSASYIIFGCPQLNSQNVVQLLILHSTTPSEKIKRKNRSWFHVQKWSKLIIFSRVLLNTQGRWFSQIIMLREELQYKLTANYWTGSWLASKLPSGSLHVLSRTKKNKIPGRSLKHYWTKALKHDSRCYVSDEISQFALNINYQHIFFFYWYPPASKSWVENSLRINKLLWPHQVCTLKKIRKGRWAGHQDQMIFFAGIIFLLPSI